MARGSNWSEATTPENVSISQAIEAFNGNKSELISEFAGTSDKKSNAYKSAQRSFNRWQAFQQPMYGPLPEGAKGKQARKISPDNQIKLNALVNARRPKSEGATIVIKGNIKINGYPRKRKISYAVSWEDVARLEEAVRDEGEEAAWEVFADLYHVKSAGWEEEGGTISIE